MEVQPVEIAGAGTAGLAAAITLVRAGKAVIVHDSPRGRLSLSPLPAGAGELDDCVIVGTARRRDLRGNNGSTASLFDQSHHHS